MHPIFLSVGKFANFVPGIFRGWPGKTPKYSLLVLFEGSGRGTPRGPENPGDPRVHKIFRGKKWPKKWSKNDPKYLLLVLFEAKKDVFFDLKFLREEIFRREKRVKFGAKNPLFLPRKTRMKQH